MAKSIKLFYTYLAGPIEFDKDTGGAKWRDAITPALDEAGIYVQDPCRTEPLVTSMSVIEAQDKFNSWITSGHYKKFDEQFEHIVKKDLRMVNRSDFIIVHLFPDISTTGTIHEMAEAWRQNKPIYLIWSDAKSKLSKWALYLVINSGGRLFDNKKQLVEYLTVRYDKNIQSLRVITIQYIQAIFRLIEEKLYNNSLEKIKKALSPTLTPKEENEPEAPKGRLVKDGETKEDK